MRITSKGQVTIPQDLRRQAGLLPGSEVEFFLDEQGRVSLRKVEGAGRGAALVETMRGRGGVKMTTDQILALTRRKR